MNFDHVITGGLVVDGTSSPATPRDIGIKDGKITAIEPTGTLASCKMAPGALIDAKGLVVTPGFIDIHTHSDATLFTTTNLNSKLRQGVTTDVTGSCSIGTAPLSEQVIEKYRSWWRWVNRWHVEAGREWKARPTWQDYTRAVADLPLKTNIAPLVGHGPIRTTVLSAEERAASSDEIRKMAALLEEAMEQGAFGLSTGLTYRPGQHADRCEIVELLKVVAKFGGFHSSHIRGEDHRLGAAIDEIIETAKEASPNLRAQVSHLKSSGKPNWGKAEAALSKIEKARAQGVDIRADVYPYVITGTFPVPLVNIKQLASAEPDLVLVVVPGNAESVSPGASVAEISKNTGKSVDETLEWLESYEVLCKSINLTEEDVSMIVAHPITCIGSDTYAMNTTRVFSQTWLHPRNFGTYPRFLSHYTRDKALMPIETAIAKITSIPAEIAGISDRGTIAIGKSADITVLNWNRIKDNSSIAYPFAYPDGIKYVLVNGHIAVRNAEDTGVVAGRLLRKN